MSFYLDFFAKTRMDAEAIIVKSTTPDSIKSFIIQALLFAKPDEPVSVKATGHLYAGLEGGGKDYDTSTALIEIKKVHYADQY